MRIKSPQKQSDNLFSWAEGSDLALRFVEDLAISLDLDKTIKNLNISRHEAREILKGLVSQNRGAAGPALRQKGTAPARAEDHYTIHVDGASRGNPGRAGAGAVISGPDRTIVKRLKSYLGVTTNNVAEYRALVMGLETARKLKIQRLKIYADSELVVKQINGKYRVRHEDLLPLYAKAMALLKGFAEYKIAHIPREKNKDADRLANEAIDGGER